MPRITPVDPASTSGKTKDLLDAVQKKLGLIPNMTRSMAVAPAVLEGYLGLSGALGHGVLDAKTRELIALTVAEANACQYCASAHTAIGKMVGLKDDQVASARAAKAENPKTAAILGLAHRIVVARGEVTDAEVAKAQAAGITAPELAEIVAHVALNILTNYFNVVAQTPIDFPEVPKAKGLVGAAR